MDYKKLQNGSDIRGVALEGIAGQPITLTEQACRDIGRGFALWLTAKTGKKEGLRVSVGRDSRLSGETLCNWICDAMVQQGLLVTNFGMFYPDHGDGEHCYAQRFRPLEEHLCPISQKPCALVTRGCVTEENKECVLLNYAP